jgi:D-alanyl-D-alanine carboxypeptidase
MHRKSALSSLLAAFLGLAYLGCSSEEPIEEIVEPEFDDRLDSASCSNDGGPLSGDDMLILVSKAPGQQLQRAWVPEDLVPVPLNMMMPGRTGYLRKGSSDAFEMLNKAALEETGFDLRIRSAYRSFGSQCRTFDFWVEQKGLEHAKRFSAEPGRSQHQLGTTIDITSEGLGFKNSSEHVDAPEYEWLEANAHRFGYTLAYPRGQEHVTGYGYEPWHYRYIGIDAAMEMHDNGLILETYLDRCQTSDIDLECPREEQPLVPPNYGFIGGTCSSDKDCESLGSGATCLGAEEGYPDGYCTIPCERGCPDRPGLNAVTFCVDTEAFGGLCHSRCDYDLFDNTGCREGYSCDEEVQRPNNGAMGSACLP